MCGQYCKDLVTSPFIESQPKPSVSMFLGFLMDLSMRKLKRLQMLRSDFNGTTHLPTKNLAAFHHSTVRYLQRSWVTWQHLEYLYNWLSIFEKVSWMGSWNLKTSNNNQPPRGFLCFTTRKFDKEAAILGRHPISSRLPGSTKCREL